MDFKFGKKTSKNRVKPASHPVLSTSLNIPAKKQNLGSRFIDGADKAFQASHNVKACRRIFRSYDAIDREQQRQRILNRFVIHPFSPFRWYWDMLMVLTLVTTLIVLPVEIAFYSDDFMLSHWKGINLFLDIVFLLDIGLNFRTGYLQHATEEVVLENKRIFIQYMKTWFVVDILSSVPFDYMYLWLSNSSLDENSDSFLLTLRVLRLTKLLSLLRLLRMARLLRYMNKLEEILDIEGNVLSMYNLILIIMVFSHWNGCVQYLVALIQNFPQNSWVVLDQLHLSNVTRWERYTTCIYRSLSHMLSIGYGRQPPQNMIETWMVVFSMTLGATFYALFIARMSSLLMSLDSSGRHYEEKVAQVKEYMRFRRVPLSIQESVLEYYDHKYQRKYFDEKMILTEPNLSHCLRQEILLHNCRSLVEKVKFLASAPTEFLTDVITRLNFQVFFPGDIIISQGKKGSSMYFIEHGKVEIQLPDGQVINTLSDGSHFGEIALIFEERRIASVVAVEICDLYCLTKTDFTEVLEDHPSMRTAMTRIARERLNKMTPAMKKMDANPEILVDEAPSYDSLGSSIPSQIMINSDSKDENIIINTYQE